MYVGSWEEFYNDYDWSELNENVEDAVKALGYNIDTWDNDEDIHTVSLPWVNLTTTEQEAAAVLGYDNCTWDREG